MTNWWTTKLSRRALGRLTAGAAALASALALPSIPAAARSSLQPSAPAGGPDEVESIHVTEWGRGDTAILVHGSLTPGTVSWQAQRPLAEAYRLLVIDRRGFGESPPATGQDFERDADDIAALLSGPPVHLMGRSYGGLGCLLAAARRPEAVRSLVVVEPAAFGVAMGHPAVDAFVAKLAALTRCSSRPLRGRDSPSVRGPLGWRSP